MENNVKSRKSGIDACGSATTLPTTADDAKKKLSKAGGVPPSETQGASVEMLGASAESCVNENSVDVNLRPTLKVINNNDAKSRKSVTIAESQGVETIQPIECNKEVTMEKKSDVVPEEYDAETDDDFEEYWGIILDSKDQACAKEKGIPLQKIGAHQENIIKTDIYNMSEISEMNELDDDLPATTNTENKNAVAEVVAEDKPVIVGEDKESSRQQDSEAEEKILAYSPNGRFIKFNVEIGHGSFKTVYKGLDTETGTLMAWCELQVNCVDL